MNFLEREKLEADKVFKDAKEYLNKQEVGMMDGRTALKNILVNYQSEVYGYDKSVLECEDNAIDKLEALFSDENFAVLYHPRLMEGRYSREDYIKCAKEEREERK